jgi:transcriptional regulator with AAA-type ATPase domain
VLFDGKDYNTVLENWETAEFTLKPKASLIYEFTEGTLKELEDAKKWLVQKALERFNYNKSRAARHLGMTYVGLHRYMRRNGME